MADKFEQGDPVVCIPPHADGPEHRDAEYGTIIGPCDAWPGRYYVDYNDGSPNAKLTREEYLIHTDKAPA